MSLIMKIALCRSVLSRRSPKRRILCEKHTVLNSLKRLDTMMEGTKFENKFFEQQKLSQENTEVRIKSSPLFIAGAGVHHLTQLIHYGSSPQDLGNENTSWAGC